jgi:3-hydroxyacyl-CoA dehydrogenase
MTDQRYTFAVVGTGVIGRSWAIAFARAGHAVRLYDIDAARAEGVAASVRSELAGLDAPGELSTHTDLRDALTGVDYVQECGPDGLDIKRAIFRELDAAAPADTILASSQSDEDTTAIADGLSGAHRCITAHPINPPHIIPVVELLPAASVPSATIERACAILRSAGQTPVVMRRFVPGLLTNRLQGAILREALQLVLEDVADVAAVDAVVSDGLGLRWALLGPIAVADANADGGARAYFITHRESWIELMDSLSPTPSFTPEQIERIGRGVEQARGGVPGDAVRAWRDQALQSLMKLKAADPAPYTMMATTWPGE